MEAVRRGLACAAAVDSPPVTAHYALVMTRPPIILASSSAPRRTLMERLNLPFRCETPDIDESGKAGETPPELVRRLAREKVQAVGQRCPNALVIGADEVAVVKDRVLSKPGGHEQAVNQLEFMSGQVVRFLTGLCLLNGGNGRLRQDIVTVEVEFRQLNAAEIERYLEADKPYECAGSFRLEAGGITLVRRISGDDDTALLGLPLISLMEMLRQEGYNLP